MKIELLSENTAFENILWAGLAIHLYVNDDWFCQIDYIGQPTQEYPHQFQLTADFLEGIKHFETIKQVFYQIYTNISNDHKIEMEITS